MFDICQYVMGSMRLDYYHRLETLVAVDVMITYGTVQGVAHVNNANNQRKQHNC